MFERSTVVRVRDGLHARPATQFVKLAKTFVSDVEICRGEVRANAKSSVKLMLLALKQDETVTMRAEGVDADEALSALVAFMETPDAGVDLAGMTPLAAGETS